MDPKPTESVISTAGIREDVLKQKLSLFFGSNATFEMKSTKDGRRAYLISSNIGVKATQADENDKKPLYQPQSIPKSSQPYSRSSEQNPYPPRRYNSYNAKSDFRHYTLDPSPVFGPRDTSVVVSPPGVEIRDDVSRAPSHYNFNDNEVNEGPNGYYLFPRDELDDSPEQSTQSGRPTRISHDSAGQAPLHSVDATQQSYVSQYSPSTTYLPGQAKKESDFKDFREWHDYRRQKEANERERHAPPQRVNYEEQRAQPYTSQRLSAEDQESPSSGVGGTEVGPAITSVVAVASSNTADMVSTVMPPIMAGLTGFSGYLGWQNLKLVRKADEREERRDLRERRREDTGHPDPDSLEPRPRAEDRDGRSEEARILERGSDDRDDRHAREECHQQAARRDRSRERRVALREIQRENAHASGTRGGQRQQDIEDQNQQRTAASLSGTRRTTHWRNSAALMASRSHASPRDVMKATRSFSLPASPTCGSDRGPERDGRDLEARFLALFPKVPSHPLPSITPDETDDDENDSNQSPKPSQGWGVTNAGQTSALDVMDL